MNSITVPMHDFRPRNYQLGLWNSRLIDKKKRMVGVWHRRAGKDLTCMNITVIEMFERVGLYWHVLPNYNQGRKVVWNGMDGDGNPFRSYIPQEMIDKERDDEMMVRLKNGSIWQVVGGDIPDRLVGSNPVGLVMSEYALHNPACWDLLRPILNENGGWVIFNYTARGYNHGWDILQAAKTSNDWFSEVLTVDDTKRPNGTPVVRPEDIEDDRRSGMPEELIRQEYWCDFNAPLVGAYYGKELDEADRDGRIGDVRWRKDLPVYTGWDIGIDDATAIWFFQIVDGMVHFIDYYAAHGEGMEYYIKLLDSEYPYIYKDHIGPHDLRVREFGSGVSRIETAFKLGLKFVIAPKLGIDDGINASRMLIGRSKFNAEKCKEGINGLRQYRREFSTRTRTWSAKAVHDWSSHPADSFRYCAVGMPSRVYRDEKPIVWHKDITFADTVKSIKKKARKGRKQWI